MNNKYLRQFLKPLFFILALIIVCAFLVNVLTDSETLAEYAENNPEQAYGSSYGNIDENEEPVQEEAQVQTEKETLTYEKNVANADTVKNQQSADVEKNVANSSSPERIIYKEGFYYEPLSEEIKNIITGVSYPVSESEAAESATPVINILDSEAEITYDDLRYLSVLHYDFDGEVQSGELICNKGIAQDLAEIFYELYLNEYQIEKIRLVDEYDADDTASITDNNTSCFNYRVVDGTTTLSKHALGCALDINPFYNPYVVFNKDGSGETYISPKGSEVYADRSKDFPYKIDENDLCYKLFKEHGFTWGGDWNSCKDYQHFQKILE